MYLFATYATKFAYLSQMLGVLTELFKMSYSSYFLILLFRLLISLPTENLNITILPLTHFVFNFLILCLFLFDLNPVHLLVHFWCQLVLWYAQIVELRHILWGHLLILLVVWIWLIIQNLIFIIYCSVFVFSCESYFIKFIRHWWSCAAVHSFSYLRLLK